MHAVFHYAQLHPRHFPNYHSWLILPLIFCWTKRSQDQKQVALLQLHITPAQPYSITKCHIPGYCEVKIHRGEDSQYLCICNFAGPLLSFISRLKHWCNITKTLYSVLNMIHLTAKGFDLKKVLPVLERSFDQRTWAINESFTCVTCPIENNRACGGNCINTSKIWPNSPVTSCPII